MFYSTIIYLNLSCSLTTHNICDTQEFLAAEAQMKKKKKINCLEFLEEHILVENCF